MMTSKKRLAAPASQNPLAADLEKRLAADHARRKSKGSWRKLTQAHGLDFSSNDYLGLSQHPALRLAAQKALDEGIPFGAGAGRLLRGNHIEHEALEFEAAQFFQSEGALYFPSGFQANLALMTGLPDRRDVVLFDSLIHASLRDGIQANPARHIRIPHNDLNAYEKQLKALRSQGHRHSIFVVIESVYSMDGDFGPVQALAHLCQTYDAQLIVDEAHATGVWGEQGRGLAPPGSISIHTCGKALGVSGALICAPQIIIDHLINTARTFIYSTAPSPFQARLVRKALKLSATMDPARTHLKTLIKAAGGQSQIIPIIIGNDQRSLDIAQTLQEKGYDIRAIRPPTVPKDTARLRISLNTGLQVQTVSNLMGVLRRYTG